MKKIFLALFIFLIPLLYFSNPTYAQEYKVKPVIFISEDWRDLTSESAIDNKFKPDIIQALKEVQQWYAQRVDGHTFNFEENVDVMKGQSIGPLPHGVDNTKDFLYYQNGEKLLPQRKGIIYAVWVIGSGNLINTATADIGSRVEGQIVNQGYAILSHQNLIDLSSASIYRNKSLASLGHELGHNFGLVRAGYAGQHTCSQISSSECSPRAPQPLPKAEECYYSIMCPINLDDFPLRSLNNSAHNPEINKIYKSPFINPQNDSPLGIDLTSQINNVSPNPIIAGESFTIKGSGFGNTKGEVLLRNSIERDLDFSVNLNDQIVDWKDNEIAVLVPEGFVTAMIKNITGQFRLIVIPPGGTRSELTVNFEDTERVYHTITVNFSLTCGDQNQPLKRMVSLSNEFPNRTLTSNKSTSNARGASDFSNDEGIGTLSYTINPFFDSLNFYIYASSIYDLNEDIYPLPNLYPVNLNSFDESIERNVSFHYPKCPTKLTGQLNTFQCDRNSKLGEYNCDNGRRCASEEYENIPGVRRCYNDFFLDSLRCWQPKINSDGNHYHCDMLCSSDGDCDSGQICEESTHTCKSTLPTTRTLRDSIELPRSPEPQGSVGLGDIVNNIGDTATNIYEGIDTGIGGILPDIPGEQPTTSEAPPPEKRITQVLIDGQNVDINSLLTQGVDTVLLGTTDHTQIIPLIITVMYSDGTERDLVYNFNYQPLLANKPEEQSPPSFPTEPSQTEPEQPNQETPANPPETPTEAPPATDTQPEEPSQSAPIPPPEPEVPQNQCPAFQEYCESNQSCQWFFQACEPQLPPQPPQACNDEFIYNECIDCNLSQPVYQNNCDGSYTTSQAQIDEACSWACPLEPQLPPQPACDEDLQYCDPATGTYIHKHDGYWDGNQCVYAFDNTEIGCE